MRLLALLLLAAGARAHERALDYYMRQAFRNEFRYSCELRTYGRGWGAHTFCRLRPNTSFLSVGIGHDWSFDADVARQTGGRGVLMDPTIAAPKNLPPALRFFPLGLHTPYDDEGVSLFDVEGLTKARFDVLKIDCEGCEYAIARDAQGDLLRRVSQINIELHITRAWIYEPEHWAAYEAFFELMRAHTFELVHMHAAQCGPKGEAPGCHPLARGFCGRNPSVNCQNLLFVK